MDNNAYKNMIIQEKEHWWFLARREIISMFMKKIAQKYDTPLILEIGCCAGGNLEMLSNYGKVSGIEMDSFAVEYAKNLGFSVQNGCFPDCMPPMEKKDIICMFDVLEHISDDKGSLKAANELLNSDGRLFLTVPAHQWLFGTHDIFLHHKRRYCKKDLLSKIQESGFLVEHVSYFNTFLFPLVLIARVVDLLKLNKRSIGYNVPNSFINFIFFKIFRSEVSYLKKNSFSFGASLVIIAKKV